VAQLVECLLRKCEALISNSSAIKRKEREGKKGGEKERRKEKERLSTRHGGTYL
jgi:hypothetical protein